MSSSLTSSKTGKCAGQSIFRILQAKIKHAQKCQASTKKETSVKTQKEKIRAIKHAKAERKNAKMRFNALGEPMQKDAPEPAQTETTKNEEKLLKIIESLNAKDQAERKDALEKINAISQNEINAYFLKSETSLNTIDSKTTADNSKTKRFFDAVDKIENFYPAYFFTGQKRALDHFKARPQTQTEMIKELTEKINRI